MSFEVRVYGKNRKKPVAGQPCYWTDIDVWIAKRKKQTGKEPTFVHVMSTSGEEWSRELSPMVLRPVSLYGGLSAVSVEIAWQYSRVYSHVLEAGWLKPTNFANPDGSPRPEWFEWRDRAWRNPAFSWGNPDFEKNKGQIRRAFPKGSMSLWYWDGHMLDRFTARREIYARLYIESVTRTAAWQRLLQLHQAGDVLIYDGDGYDDIALAKTPEETLLDPNHPWGHGTLLGFLLRGIDPLKLGPPSVRTPVRNLMKPKPISKDAIFLNKSAEAFGWLNNMNSAFPVKMDGIDYVSSEHAFIALRFPEQSPIHQVISEVKNPLLVKRVVRKKVKDLRISLTDLRTSKDLDRMRRVLCLKLQQHPELVSALMATHPRWIAEDCKGREEEQEIDSGTVSVPYWGIKILDDGTYIGENQFGSLWMELRDELVNKGRCMSPQGDILVTANKLEVIPKLRDMPLNSKEKQSLEVCEKAVEEGRKEMENGFQRMVVAMAQIAEERLYRDADPTLAGYFWNRWRIERAHAYRLIECGLNLQRWRQNHPLVEGFHNQAFFRPLLGEDKAKLHEPVLLRIEEWQKKDPALVLNPGIVTAALETVRNVVPPSPPDPKVRLSEVLGILRKAQKAGKWDKVSSEVKGLVDPRTTAINWSEKTWNPLVGCKKISAGCQYCYAATLLGRRLKGLYPGIADFDSKRKKQSPYNFTGKVWYNWEAMAEPLQVKTPSRYFVNSLSDLFYDVVPDWFVDAVFDTMEKAVWHNFQVLTKRPDRMAAYTKKRYADRQPPKHIWLGATIEDQNAHDTRIAYLRQVKTAVRWISAEPCIAPINFELKDIHWLVLGGETGSTRRMDKQWVLSILAQVTKAKVPFFFKQWGRYGEDGKVKKPVKYPKGKKPKRKPPETIDGKAYEQFPV